MQKNIGFMKKISHLIKICCFLSSNTQIFYRHYCLIPDKTIILKRLRVDAFAFNLSILTMLKG